MIIVTLDHAAIGVSPEPAMSDRPTLPRFSTPFLIFRPMLTCGLGGVYIVWKQLGATAT